MDTGAATVVHIVKLAIQIKEAADTARQNKHDCVHVKRRVEVLHRTVLQYERAVEVVENEAVQSALERVKEVLDEALVVVTDCCQERSTLSKDLIKLNVLISDAETDITAAATAYLITTTKARYLESVAHVDVAFTNMHVAQPLSSSLSLPQKITKVAVEIKEAVNKVQRNRVGFMQIEKRADSVSGLMAQLENYTDQKGMTAALKELLVTFKKAHTLVMSYQGIRINVILQLNRKLVQEVDEVLDAMLDGVNAVNTIIMNGLPSRSQGFEVNGDSASADDQYKQALVPDDIITT